MYQYISIHTNSSVRCKTQKVIVKRHYYVDTCVGDELLITHVLLKKLTSVHGYVLSDEPSNFVSLVSL